MRNIILALALLIAFSICNAQDPIILTYSPEGQRIQESTQKIGLKVGDTYKVRITGVNTAFMNAELVPKAYTLSSPTPDVVQQIFPGITTSDLLELLNILPDTIRFEDGISVFYEFALERYEKLIKLKAISDSLYTKTEAKPDISLAGSAKTQVFSTFNVSSFSELRKVLNQYHNYIVIADGLFRAKVNELDVAILLDQQILEKSAELSYIVANTKIGSSMKYASFIETSMNAKTYVDSKPFVAKKDVIDLNTVLVNSYTSDTLYNQKLPFYTKGSFSFDFSTGFFYNSLYEKSYYLETRDSTAKNILVEDDIKFDVAIGALGHFSYKFTNSFRAGLSLGAALSPLDVKLRYLFGGSLVFGRKNQLALSSGVSIAKLEVLSNSVLSDENGTYVGADVTSVPKYKKLRKGYFIGLSYNLIRTRK